MRQLPQKEIKRCTKILNWKYKTDHVTYWYVDESGETQYREWEDGYHRQITITDVLFVRLWDRLCEKLDTTAAPGTEMRLVRFAGMPQLVGLNIDGEIIVANDHHPCLALYEAISKLMENKR